MKTIKNARSDRLHGQKWPKPVRCPVALDLAARTGHRLLRLRACVSSAGRTNTEEVAAGTTGGGNQCRCVLVAVLTRHARTLASEAGTARSQSVWLYSTEMARKRLGPKWSAALEKMTSRGTDIL